MPVSRRPRLRKHLLQANIRGLHPKLPCIHADPSQPINYAIERVVIFENAVFLEKNFEAVVGLSFTFTWH